MFSLDFAGWFECRLATDPDAYDDPRGQSGWTFALPGEPDLDRVIRFQAPVAPRSHGQTVGVTVREVRQSDTPVADSPLLGSAVEILDNPVFEGRNGMIATSANEPIAPFQIRIASGELQLIGRDAIDLTDPAEVIRRQPIDFEPNSAEVAQATGISNYAAHRQSRRALLQSDLASETDPTRRAALEKRIQELGKGSVRLASLGFKMSYQFDLRGPNEWTDPAGLLGVAPAAGATWAARFWMGAWDADALSGYVLGTLSIRV